MKAIVQARYGTAEQWTLSDLPVPKPGRGQVRVKVRAAAVDRGTWHLMVGEPLVVRLGFGLRGPKQPVPGLDLAGVVESVGEEVTRLALGDEVFGTGTGSFAEYAVAPDSQLASKPAGLSFEEAAAIPVSGQTALQALRDVGHVQAGQCVLVIGASGGVGSYAVQLAKSLGAEVTGVCSTTKVDAVRRLGADHVVDYTKAEIDADGRSYDLVLDIAGNRPIRLLRKVLAADGTLVIVGGEQGGRLFGGLHRQFGAKLLSPFVGQTLTFFVSKEQTATLEQLSELLSRDGFRPPVDRVFPLADAAKAMDYFACGHVLGKVVLSV